MSYRYVCVILEGMDKRSILLFNLERLVLYCYDKLLLRYGAKHRTHSLLPSRQTYLPFELITLLVSLTILHPPIKTSDTVTTTFGKFSNSYLVHNLWFDIRCCLHSQWYLHDILGGQPCCFLSSLEAVQAACAACGPLLEQPFRQRAGWMLGVLMIFPTLRVTGAQLGDWEECRGCSGVWPSTGDSSRLQTQHTSPS